jgi:hypothetical protein
MVSDVSEDNDMKTTQQTSKKRDARTAGIKALIAAASIAATVAGWALLPSNDPQASAAPTEQTDQLGMPSTTQTDPFATSPQTPDFQPPTTSSDPGLPQVQIPNNSSGRLMPFTRSHASR